MWTVAGQERVVVRTGGDYKEVAELGGRAGDVPSQKAKVEELIESSQ